MQFDQEDIGNALAETLGEVSRDGRTDVWLCFWDRLTEGQYVPERPLWSYEIEPSDGFNDG